MCAFQIRFEWEEPPHARAPELKASWARLEISIDGIPVTKVEDLRSHGVRTGIYVPLYPIAEWMAANWWFLWNEWRTDGPFTRHNLRAAKEGFPLPDLHFSPTETRIKLDWHSLPATNAERISFLSSGSSTLEKDAVRDELHRFIDAVIQRLSERDISGTFLQSEWEAVLATEQDPEQRRFCEQSARMGVDPFDPPPGVADALEELERQLPQPLVNDFCDAITTAELLTGIAAVRQFLPPRDQRTHYASEIRGLFQPPNTGTPWKDGYVQAQKLRNHLSLQGPIEGDLVRMLETMLDVEGVSIVDVARRIEGIASPPNGTGARIGMTERVAQDEHRKRFLICRALSDLLSGGGPSLITKANTEHQQRNRAFAAEFLAPAQDIRDRLPAAVLSGEDIDDLAHEFKVSDYVIRFQVENHQLATIASDF